MHSKSWLLALGAGLALVASVAFGFRLGTGVWPNRDLLLAQWDGASASQTTKGVSVPEPKKILYYRNPMGAPDTSPVAKKDSMGMDYIAVYDEDAAAAPEDAKTVKISLDKVQRSGVRTAIAELRRLVSPIHASGKVALDERTLHTITLRVDGYIDKLYVNAVGQPVKQGEPMFRLFSQEVLNAEALYLVAIQNGGKLSPANQGALRRLENLGLPESHLHKIGVTGAVPADIEWPSPVSGVVIEKMIVEGERAEPGRALFKIADPSHLWVMADVAEQDADKIRTGADVTMTFRALPGIRVVGKLSFIYPGLNAETRTAKVRIDLANPEGRFRPDMYADVTIDTGASDGQVLAVPVDSIIDSAGKQVVILDKGDGRFEPREVTLGGRGDGFVAIKTGVAAGDKIVTAANFLIDAESNLRAALAAFTAEPKAVEPAPGAKPQASLGTTNAAKASP